MEKLRTIMPDEVEIPEKAQTHYESCRELLKLAKENGGGWAELPLDSPLSPSPVLSPEARKGFRAALDSTAYLFEN